MSVNLSTRSFVKLLDFTPREIEYLLELSRDLKRNKTDGREQQALKGKVDEMLKDLSPREEKILRLRFGFNGETRTLEEIGKEIGLSRERVRQIEKRAKARLRVRTKNDSLIDHLN